MKKLIAYLFILLYFVTSTGATVQLHYCMDKLVSLDVNSATKKNCGECGMEKEGHKGCCHDENKFIKIENDHKASLASYSFLQLDSSLDIVMNANEEFTPSFNIATTFPSDHAPPATEKVPLYLYNCSFLI